MSKSMRLEWRFVDEEMNSILEKLWK